MPQCPDFEFIRKKISIVAVAEQLGLGVTGYRARCWRTESHRNGDANPSIGFMKKNNLGRCFVCDAHTWSNIDLVMMRNACDLRAAVSWIMRYFPVPTLSIGAHITRRETWSPRFHASDSDSIIAMLVRAGIWRTLSHAERSILPALATFTDSHTGLAEVSYRGLMQYSGVGSQATIAKAIRHFEQMRLVRVIRTRGVYPLRNASKYQITLEDPEFQTLVMRAFHRQREEIEYQRQLQSEARKERRRKSGLV